MLEGLARHLDVKVEEDIEAATGKPSGLLNLFVSGAKGEKINLLDPAGPKVISTDWRQDAKKNEFVRCPGDMNPAYFVPQKHLNKEW